MVHLRLMQVVYIPLNTIFWHFNVMLPIFRRSTRSIEEEPTALAVKRIVGHFLASIETPEHKTVHAPGMRYMPSAILEYTSLWMIPLTVLKHPNEVISTQSAAMAELSYPGHRFEVKFFIGMFTWFMLYIDDSAEDMRDAIVEFQERYIAGKPQREPLLDKFAEHLLKAYDHWDALIANSIISSALEYVTGTALETNGALRSVKFNKNTINFAYFLRAKTGVAQAYALMLFPMLENPDRGQFITSVADISFFIDMTNDILSFYKEELAGEDTNYIHNRARCLELTPLVVLQDVTGETNAAATRATLALSDMSTPAATAWRLFQQGFVGFHVTQTRYRLSELDLGWQLE